MKRSPLLLAAGIAIVLTLIGCNRPETKQNIAKDEFGLSPASATLQEKQEQLAKIKAEAARLKAKNDAWTEKNYSEGSPQRVQLDAERAKTKIDAAKAEAEAKAESEKDRWRYSEDIEKMTSKVTKLAFITSENSFNFAFPYAGENYGSLMIRQRASDGLSVMFSISKGQIICMPSCSISVRFDDKPAMKFNANLPSDYSSNAIFLSPASKFLSELKKSKRVLVEATYHSAGAKISEFATEGFKWEGKVAK